MVILNHVSRPNPMSSMRSTLELHFDFVVTEKSIYTPGSGPEVPDPTPMAEHDRDGFIISELSIDRANFTYIVTWRDKPHLLVSVRPQKIRDYVSARSYEEWNTKKMQEELNGPLPENLRTDEQTELKPKSQIVRKRRKKRKTIDAIECTQNSQVTVKIANNFGQSISLSPGQASFISPSSQDLNIDNEIYNNEARKQFAPKKSKTGGSFTAEEKSSMSLSIPLTEEETVGELQRSYFDSQARSFSAEQPPLNGENKQTILALPSDTSAVRELTLAKLRNTRPISNTATPVLSKTTEKKLVESIISHEQKAPEVNLFSSNVNVTLKAQRKDQKNLAKKSQNKRSRQSFTSYIESKPTPLRPRKKTINSVPRLENESDSDVEYVVEDIKDEKWEQDRKGNGVLFYLVKWKGIPSYTWEPEENISSDVLTEYTVQKLSRSKNRSRRSLDRSSLSFDTEDKKEATKGKQVEYINHEGIELDKIKTDRKAKQKAMAINMFEPDIPRKKGSGIPGDLGDEDEPFQVPSGRRRK
ncbi:hypothetical protein HI914_04870 [Erysiphe necator]|uniref:Putative chromo domain-containing protein n=1 Tax=Uncinula necator TaxID=52586 RepID=A0A0B1P263_UNCNE|nr:hypothetical protein HI914_04870 [Erysiphe necator]KHJ32757.1 putative chromo domain-containing protein [Erysiphe necator]